MHDGAAETLSEAITQHAREAAHSGKRFLALGEMDRQGLLAS